jgi:hypothetical protein
VQDRAEQAARSYRSGSHGTNTASLATNSNGGGLSAAVTAGVEDAAGAGTDASRDGIRRRASDQNDATTPFYTPVGLSR